MRTWIALLALLPFPALAGLECKREKNSEGEVITKCETTGESQIKVKIDREEAKQIIGKEKPVENVPTALLAEIARTNDASLLDWPCS